MKHKPKIAIFVVSLLLSSTSQAMWDTSDPHRFAGDVIQLAIPVTGLGIAMNQSDVEGMKQLGYTVAVTAVTTEGLKRTLNSTQLGERPDGTPYAFPSGHASNACAGATFIGQRYGWKYGSIAMIPAGYASWTRVEANRHHVRDIVAGCALGVVTGLIFTTPKDETVIIPWYENETIGITIKSKW